MEPKAKWTRDEKNPTIWRASIGEDTIWLTASPNSWGAGYAYTQPLIDRRGRLACYSSHTTTSEGDLVDNMLKAEAEALQLIETWAAALR